MFSNEAVEADRLANLGEEPQLNPAAAERAHRQRLREQERRDEIMAQRLWEEQMHGQNDERMQERVRRRMQDFGFNDPPNNPIARGALGMDEEFMRRAADALSAVFNPIEEGRHRRSVPQEPTVLPLPPQHRPRQQSPAMQQYISSRAPGRQNEQLVPRRSMTNYTAEAEIHRPVATETRASLLAGMARGQIGDGRVEEWRRHVDPLI